MISSQGYINALTILDVRKFFERVGNILIKDSEYQSQQWWYEEKIEYLRNLSIYGTSSIPVVSLMNDDDNTLVILKEANKLLTLKGVLEGRIKVPQNIFYLTEEFCDSYCDILELPEVDKFLRTRFYINAVKNNNNTDWSDIEKIYRNL